MKVWKNPTQQKYWETHREKILEKRRPKYGEEYQKNKEQVKARATLHYIQNKEEKKQYGRDYYKAHREKYLHRAYLWKIQKKYGLTLTQYEHLLTSQSNQCAVCNEEFITKPHIDHDHQTGRVRGLLCLQCNHLLGNARDNTDILVSAVRYLERQV